MNRHRSTKSWQVMGESFDLSTRFKVIDYLGSGAYGMVCAVHDYQDNEVVAIKKCKKIFQSRTLAKRTLREMRLLRLISHENVVKLKTILPPLDEKYYTDLYLVFEVMDTDLAQIIRSQQPLKEQHTQYFTYQLLRALEYLHSKNIVHRDIKPRNILVNADCTLKVADFGLARLYRQDGPERVTAITDYVTTRWYRAPEVIVGWSSYSAGVDMWAVGCIVAELLSRAPLFPGENTMKQLGLIIRVLGSPSEAFVMRSTKSMFRQYMMSFLNRPPSQLSLLLPQASPDAVDLIRRLLDYDPARRPTATAALAHPFIARMSSSLSPPLCSPMGIAPEEFEYEARKLTIDDLRAEIAYEIDYHNLPRKLQTAELPPVTSSIDAAAEGVFEEGEGEEEAAGEGEPGEEEGTLVDVQGEIYGEEENHKLAQEAMVEEGSGQGSGQDQPTDSGAWAVDDALLAEEVQEGEEGETQKEEGLELMPPHPPPMQEPSLRPCLHESTSAGGPRSAYTEQARAEDSGSSHSGLRTRLPGRLVSPARDALPLASYPASVPIRRTRVPGRVVSPEAAPAPLTAPLASRQYHPFTPKRATLPAVHARSGVKAGAAAVSDEEVAAGVLEGVEALLRGSSGESDDTSALVFRDACRKGEMREGAGRLQQLQPPASKGKDVREAQLARTTSPLATAWQEHGSGSIDIECGAPTAHAYEQLRRQHAPPSASAAGSVSAQREGRMGRQRTFSAERAAEEEAALVSSYFTCFCEQPGEEKQTRQPRRHRSSSSSSSLDEEEGKVGIEEAGFDGYETVVNGGERGGEGEDGAGARPVRGHRRSWASAGAGGGGPGGGRGSSSRRSWEQFGSSCTVS